MSHHSRSVAESFSCTTADLVAVPPTKTTTENEAAASGVENNIIYERNRVTVCLRIRPPLGERRSDPNNFLRWSNRYPNRITIENSAHRKKKFEFDHVFTEQVIQADIYQLTAKQLIPSFLDGQNVCCLAFGQSKSGKTYTAIGEVDTSSSSSRRPIRDSSDSSDSSSCVSSLGSCGVSEVVTKDSKAFPTAPTTATLDQKMDVPTHLGITTTNSPHRYLGQKRQRRKVDLPGINEDYEDDIFPSFITERTGIILRLLYQIISQIESTEKSRKAILKLYCSCVEVHYDKVIDLLAGPNSLSNTVTLQQSLDGNLCLEGATEELILNCNVALELLQRYTSKRQEDSTSKRSSFYHTIFVLKLEKTNYASQETTKNFFCIVDLAKSDVLLLNDNDDCSSSGFPIKQETFVFRTLTTLCSTLSNNAEPVAAHHDTFSKMIQNAFGHVSKICLILNVSPNAIDAKHTLQTLCYGQRIMSLEKVDGEQRLLTAVDEKKEEKIENLARESLQGEDLKAKKISYLGAKMLEMQDELQKFRIEADERSRISTRSFKSGGIKSGRKGNVNSRNYDSLQTTLKAPNQIEAQKEDKAALVAPSVQRTAPEFSRVTTAKEREVESSSDSPVAESLSRGTCTPVVENLSRGGPPAALREGSVAMGNSRVSSHNESGINEFLSLERLRHKLRKRERMLKERDAVILGMRRENLALEKSKRKRQVLLDKAKNEMKALLNRVMEAESHLLEVKESCQSMGSQEIVKLSKDLHKDGSTTTITNEQITTTEEQSNFTALTTGTVELSTLKEELIRVGLRLRPLNKLEASRRSRCCIDIQEGSTDFTVDSPLDGEYDFHYDKVFDMDASQGEVYDFIRKSGVDDVLQGLNCSCVVYGLSGSGKSYTLLGDLPYLWERLDSKSACSTVDKDDKWGTASNADDSCFGIIPRIFKDLFEGIECANENIEFFVRCSFVGIYLEKIFDLVEPQSNKNLLVVRDCNSVHIDGASEVWCFRDSDAMAIIRRGTAALAVISRRMDIDVENVHKILNITVEQRDGLTGTWRVSNFLLADIAAAPSKSASKNDLMQEQTPGKHFNASSSSFATMIKLLADGKKEFSYSESKITSLLRDAFGGNCKTTVVITASPASYSISETIAAIRLGYRCRKILNAPRIYQFVSPSKSLKGKAPKVTEVDLPQSVTNRGLEKESPERDACLLEHMEEAMKFKTESESIICSLQTDMQLLRKQNSSLKNDLKRKDSIIMEQRNELKILESKISAAEHKLGSFHRRERDALMFMRQYRKLCWKLQKDLTRDRAKEISAVASLLPGTPDLSGLVELDTLLLRAGLIDQRDFIDADEVDEDSLDEYLSEPTTSTVVNNAYVDFPHRAGEGDLETGKTVHINSDTTSQGFGSNITKVANQKRAGLKLRLTAIASHLPFHTHQSPQSSFCSRRSCPNEASLESKNGDTISHNGHARSAQREHQHEKELRVLTQKCVELQVLLNEEKSKIQALTTKGGNLNNKKLSQEVLSLTKERDEMVHNAKAAFWKLHELHSVNKILLKKAQDSKVQVASLEEGFQRLQQSFRETALESLENEKKLHDEISALQSVIDALTSYEEQYNNAEFPECYLNFTLRGKGKGRTSSDKNNKVGKKEVDSSIPQRQQFAFFKRSRNRRVVASKQPVIKFYRRSRKRGTSLGGANKSKMIAIQRRKVTLILFEGRELFYSVLSGMV